MKKNLRRLLQPNTVALFGGRWAENVAYQIKDSNFSGEVWPVNPIRKSIAGYRCYKTTDELPGPIDAAFIGVNKNKTIEILREIKKVAFGGATCFPSG